MDTEANRKTMNIADASESQPTLGTNPHFPSLNWGEPKQLITDAIPISRGGKATPCSSPMASPGGMGLTIPLPSPIITKRTRTNSTYDRAMENPIERGYIKYFSRGKGHGFIMSDRGGDEIFVHISDIEGEYVPKEGDEVTYRLCPIPPKLEKYQAIHVRVVNFSPSVHLKWDSPLREDEKDDLVKTLMVD